jgi:hypothetical protein
MAGQIEVAHSKDVIGAGMVAGGPFACAETASSQLFPYWPVVLWQNASQAANECMQVGWGVPDADALAKRAKELADNGKIDPLSGLGDDKVYLFSMPIRPCCAPWWRPTNASTRRRGCRPRKA